MTAFQGAGLIIVAYCIAGWLGYLVGVERGIQKCNTHRYRRREHED